MTQSIDIKNNVYDITINNNGKTLWNRREIWRIMVLPILDRADLLQKAAVTGDIAVKIYA